MATLVFPHADPRRLLATFPGTQRYVHRELPVVVATMLGGEGGS